MDTIDVVEGTLARTTEDVAIASYMNFLIVNGGVIVPQYDDEYDELALKQVQARCSPTARSWACAPSEVAYGGGNIHCITQQQPSGK